MVNKLAIVLYITITAFAAGILKASIGATYIIDYEWVFVFIGWNVASFLCGYIYGKGCNKCR